MFDNSGNCELVAKLELRRTDQGIFSKEQRHDVRNLHLCNDQVCIDLTYFNFRWKEQRRKGKRKRKRKGERKGKREGKEGKRSFEKEMILHKAGIDTKINLVYVNDY
jgi:hypothetical protein